MGSIYLQSVFFRLPSPFNTPTFYLIIWIFMIASYYNKILFNKYITIFYLLFGILLLGKFLFWADLDIGGGKLSFKWIFYNIAYFYLAVLMLTYFIKSNDYNGLRIVVKFALIFIVITAITSIIGLTLFPGATRMMANSSSGSRTLMFQQIGIGRYGYFVGIAYLLPIVAFCSKNKQFSIKLRISSLIVGFLLIFALIKSEFTTALIIGSSFFLFSFLVKKNILKVYLTGIFVFFLVFVLINQQLADLLNYISNYLSSNILQSRIKDLAILLTVQDFNPETGITYTVSTRLFLVKKSIIAFLENPIVGGAGNRGGHSYFIDRLAMFGLLAFLPWLIIIKNLLSYKNHFSDDYKNSFLLSFMVYISIGIMTTSIETPQAAVSMYFIVPGSYILMYYGRNSTTTLKRLKSVLVRYN